MLGILKLKGIKTFSVVASKVHGCGLWNVSVKINEG
jgi:hypothetical protein